MNEDLTRFLLERISALEDANRQLTNSELVKTETIEALRREVNYLNNTKKL
tara:strand:+ start:3058 stop:3210 length:153 start_codon:yes stop_codon:yes gene_type:complete